MISIVEIHKLYQNKRKHVIEDYERRIVNDSIDAAAREFLHAKVLRTPEAKKGMLEQAKFMLTIVGSEHRNIEVFFLERVIAILSRNEEDNEELIEKLAEKFQYQTDNTKNKYNVTTESNESFFNRWKKKLLG